MSEQQETFAVGDRVQCQNAKRCEGVVTRLVERPGQFYVAWECGCERSSEQLIDNPGVLAVIARAQAPATTAAPETPRAFVVGDRVRNRSGDNLLVVAVGNIKNYNNGSDEVWLQYPAGNRTWLPADGAHDCLTLVTPAAPAEPAWLVEARKELPPGWSMRLLGTDESRGHEYANVEFIADDGEVVGTEDEIRRGATDALWSVRGCVRAACKEDVRPDPYATPTVEDGAGVPPPMPSDSPPFECNDCLAPVTPPRWKCCECCECPNRNMDDEGRCRACGTDWSETRPVPMPAPDLSLTNECGFPVMPKRRGFADEVGEAIDTAKHVAQKPARPVPQWGDVVEWYVPIRRDDGSDTMRRTRGLVVPTDGNGDKPRFGYLWARRKHEGLTAYACVSVDLVTIVESGAKR